MSSDDKIKCFVEGFFWLITAMVTALFLYNDPELYSGGFLFFVMVWVAIVLMLVLSYVNFYASLGRRGAKIKQKNKHIEP